MQEDLKELINNNKGLIFSIINKFKGDKEDLFQAGCLGLIDAYYKYNPSLNTKFTTYAFPFILGEVYKYTINNKNIHIPNDLIKLNSAIKKASEYLTQRYKREPNDLELSSFLEIPIYKLQEARNYLSTVSLDMEIDDGNLYDFISLENINKDDLIMLKDALGKLDSKERELIIKRYFYNKTQSEIANDLGVNQVKVSREETKVLTKLRSYM